MTGFLIEVKMIGESEYQYLTNIAAENEGAAIVRVTEEHLRTPLVPIVTGRKSPTLLVPRERIESYRITERPRKDSD